VFLVGLWGGCVCLCLFVRSDLVWGVFVVDECLCKSFVMFMFLAWVVLGFVVGLFCLL